MTKSKSAQMKDAALVALQDSNSLTEAAERAGISGREMFAHVHNDSDFAMTYKENRARQMITYADSLAARRDHALEVVTAILDDAEQPGAVRLKAAQTILAATAEQVQVVDTIVSHEVSRARERRQGFLKWWDD